jgi:hypothetical protein
MAAVTLGPTWGLCGQIRIRQLSDFPLDMRLGPAPPAGAFFRLQHGQNLDSHGDGEQETHPPTAAT